MTDSFHLNCSDEKSRPAILDAKPEWGGTPGEKMGLEENRHKHEHRNRDSEI